ncbi:LOB domain-containing protein 16-like [Mercurialis annua]|uniref:LOB domain-containing protein 16-like n=1 Tax=Mercurialis annua TaxID=3986 RepID=UPI00215E482F|nr:LOB domain-containing protein 16-like [Mercurialis annua]
MASSGSSTTGSPCGACKFLRRKCASDCIFAPYFCSEQGAARFAAIHKVFGASNVSKLLLHVPVADRCEAVVTIAYEAQARIRDPVYGCVAHIFALQQQVACLQAQLMQVKAQVAQNMENQWQGNVNGMTSAFVGNSYNNPMCSQGSIEGIIRMQDIQRSREEYGYQFSTNSKIRTFDCTELGELEEIALRMMRN